MSWAVSARNTSPVPDIFIRVVPSPETAFLISRLMPPEPACSNDTSPWYATIDPALAWIVIWLRLTFSSFEFWSANGCCDCVSWNSPSVLCKGDSFSDGLPVESIGGTGYAHQHLLRRALLF